MPEEKTTLTDRELAILRQVAELWGVTLEEAAERLQSEAMEQRVRRKTGRGPARVYDIRSRRH